MGSPIEDIASLCIGSVEEVSPSEIRVSLDIDAPQATALNTGSPAPFPRINGYVIIPNQTGAIVGLITWLGIQHSPFPKRTGIQDFGVIDLPYPLRKMTITPVGALRRRRGVFSEGGAEYEVVRGISVFPSVGDPVQIPTPRQLKGIIEAGKGGGAIRIGTSPLLEEASIHVNPDRLFGRHLAVLGNTGSGKSCSLAGIIRWSLESAFTAMGSKLTNRPAARFIVLDPNGEYSQAFANLPVHTDVYTANPTSELARPLSVPVWLWNSMEWCSFTRAAPQVQRPVLLQALKEVRGIPDNVESNLDRVYQLLHAYRVLIAKAGRQGPASYGAFPGQNQFGQQLANLLQDTKGLKSDSFSVDLKVSLDSLTDVLVHLLESKDASYTAKDGKYHQSYKPFSRVDVLQVLRAVTRSVKIVGPPQTDNAAGEDVPVAFRLDALVQRVEAIARDLGQADKVDTLLMRLRLLKSDARISGMVLRNEPADLASWLEEYLGDASEGKVSIIDLSLVPSDVLHTVIAVVARVVFEAVQRYKRKNLAELPTVLVLEEAHNFVRIGADDLGDHTNPDRMCRETFEKIAREGRKFGLGLVLSSQRPSELSPTVLAQCNTFLIHRIVNDRDQDQVRRLVPDNLSGLLRELPGLPTRQAILLGWAASMPVLVDIRELPEHHRPNSSDPHFWSVWTRILPRGADWRSLAAEWTHTHSVQDEVPTGSGVSPLPDSTKESVSKAHDGSTDSPASS